MPRKRKTASGTEAQPVVDIPASRHGEAAQLQNQMGAAPMQGPAPTAGAPSTPAPGGRPAPMFGPSAFRPTERPGEPIQEGIPFGPGGNGGNRVIPTDTLDDFLRAIYKVYPSNAILRLLKE